jgi:hypothetical protein
LAASQLRGLLTFGPASAFDGLVGVLFTPRIPTVTRTAVGVIMQNRNHGFVAPSAVFMLASG